MFFLLLCFSVLGAFYFLGHDIAHRNQISFSFIWFRHHQEPKWQAGNVYTPADAVAQGLKTLSLNETRVLFRTISDWFRRFEN